MQPLPPEHRHALVVAPLLEPARAQLRAGQGQRTNWQPPAASGGYGEPWVRDLLRALAESGADLLVIPPPDSHALGEQALALTGLEAARRHGAVACAWTTEAGPDAGHTPTWGCWSPAEPGHALQPWPHAGAPRDWVDLPRDAAASPLVSVVVRSMDRDTLGPTLDSIALQTWPHVEVVLVNALGAGHRPVPTQCGGLPLRTTASADGHALARARAANLGLDQAHGELALFLDDDDLLLPDHLAKLVAALEANADAAAAFSDVDMGQVEAGRWRTLHLFDAGFDLTRLLFENYLPIHAVLFRRPAQLRLDEGFDLFEDWDFWLQLAQTGRFVHAPGVSARYRVHGLQQSNVFSDTPSARQARTALFDKWRLCLSPERYHAALQRLQQLYRSNARQQAELALAKEGAQAQLAVLQAREGEIEAALQERAATRQLVQAREQELADALAEVGALRTVLTAREADARAAAAHAGGLAEQLAAREHEADNARAHITGLETTLAARDREIADAMTHTAQLTAVLAARDEEIANLRSHLAQLAQQLAEQERQLAARTQELAALQAETPLLALKRTLRKKNHASTER